MSDDEKKEKALQIARSEAEQKICNAFYNGQAAVKPGEVFYTNNPGLDWLSGEYFHYPRPVAPHHLGQSDDKSAPEAKGAIGWICPVCGSGISPKAVKCDCKAK